MCRAYHCVVSTRVAVAAAFAAVVSGCSSTPSPTPTAASAATPRVRHAPPGPTISADPAWAPLLTISYTTQPETSAARGSCATGYIQTDPKFDAPPPAYRCVYDSYSPTPIVATIGVGYAFSLGSTHCGVSVVQFDGALFVNDLLNANRFAPPINILPWGTMTLVSDDKARFVAVTGEVVTFHAISSIQLPGCA